MTHVTKQHVSILDRGLHYGDGLFETMLVCAGQIPLLAGHQRRLAEGLRRLAIDADEPDIWKQVEQQALSVGEGSLKLMLTRGEGPRGYLPSTQSIPGIYILPYPSDSKSASNLQQSWIVRFCTTPASLNPALAGLKSLNRLDSVLARMEWQDARIHEGLLADMHGNLIEGTRSNLFCVTNGRILTPLLDQAGVAGVVRHWVMDHFKVEQVRLDRATLLAADEIFMTNSLMGLAAVRQIESHSFPAPGPVTAEIRQKFMEVIA